MKHITLFAFALALAIASHAQDTARWSAHLGGTSFFRDAEYFMPFTKGYTISGFRVAPTLQYQTGKLTFEGGALLTAVAGTDGLYRAEPVLTISYTPLDWLTLNMGTLKGGNLLGDNLHQVGEPMLDPERWYLSPKEDGVQILTHKMITRHCSWTSDTWVNWERFFLPGQADQERFTLGSAHRLSRRSLILDAAFMGCHRGGQFSALDTCIETLFNERVGLGYIFNPLHARPTLNLRVDAYFFQNASPEKHRHTAYTYGYGLHPNAALVMTPRKRSDDRLILDLGYWYGNQYISARGSWLFQSVSWCDPAYLQPLRRMLTARLSYTHNLLNLNAQLYHDLDLHRTDFALSLILHFQASHTIQWNR